MSHISPYQRPQRELLSLKTDDIPGASSKFKIHERSLVYDKEPSYTRMTDHRDYTNVPKYYHPQRDQGDLPDAYELERRVKDARAFDGESLKDLGTALQHSVVYSRERDKYKMPNEREIFLHNYENVNGLLAKGNRRRYKS